MSLPNPKRPTVRIVEVGPRDGLQNIKSSIPTATKVELILRLAQAGNGTIELTSVVSPKAVPQLSDNQVLLRDSGIRRLLEQGQLRLPVLVPNLKGLKAAASAGVREVAVFVSATEGFSRANINCTVEEGLQRARAVCAEAAGRGVAVRGYISCIFADPWDGLTPQAAVLRVVKALLDAGCYEVSLGDTTGIGCAADVTSLFSFLETNGISVAQLAGHFHDTYGQGVSNVWAAFQSGVRVFDSSVGGLGGCPFAPGAKGNVATEDVVYMLHQAGISTGIDLDKICTIGGWITDVIACGNASRAGPALLTKRNGGPPTKTEAKEQKPAPQTPQIAWERQNLGDGDLRIYRAGPDVKIVLNRPRNGNALTANMIQTLCAFFLKAKNDESITRVALTANGRYFCTGMDLSKSSTPVGSSQAETRDAQYERLTTLFHLIHTAPQVTVAAVQGPAFGGGVGLAFACDVRLVDSRATFTLSEVTLGLCPATISKHVVREWGFAFAREAMLSARAVTAAQLLSLGIITQISSAADLLGDLDSYLVGLRKAGPRASSMSKELVELAWRHAGDEVQEAGIKRLFDEMMRDDGEGAFGVKEFQAGRRPVDWAAFTKKPKAKL
ncbi:hypothetical protein LTR74_012879 [Friedmanniomyces endolithicus]|nr:hypothetical protein LTR74_012879 [Friedmanniomyces endolithicus]